MVKVGDKISDVGFKVMGADGPQDMSASDLFDGKKVVVFSVPGAFTPTCSAKHLPGFIEQHDALKSKGVDTIACVAVNDAFVMDAWGKSQGAGDKVVMLADGSGDWTKSVDLELDLTAAGLGKRGQRFAMIVDNGTISHLAVEEGGAFDVSSAEKILEAL
ncbi:peroxiredoxin [Aestuariispira insulae]|uniref:Glutathione-dependent peroxiredoxin n=1 Tax=Aestuariispira insulae TaxID=1461337 RepID=A0A3D9HY70_9PROT|nr:peroxiredoxin [Aestuariispira insulae]RED54359.1 peroxiredoxin [Aestuariispira insulae]